MDDYYSCHSGVSSSIVVALRAVLVSAIAFRLCGRLERRRRSPVGRSRRFQSPGRESVRAASAGE